MEKVYIKASVTIRYDLFWLCVGLPTLCQSCHHVIIGGISFLKGGGNEMGVENRGNILK